MFATDDNSKLTQMTRCINVLPKPMVKNVSATEI